MLATPRVAGIVLGAVRTAVSEVHAVGKDAVALVDSVQQAVRTLQEAGHGTLTRVVPRTVARVGVLTVLLSNAEVFCKQHVIEVPYIGDRTVHT